MGASDALKIGMAAIRDEQAAGIASGAMDMIKGGIGVYGAYDAGVDTSNPDVIRNATSYDPLSGQKAAPFSLEEDMWEFAAPSPGPVTTPDIELGAATSDLRNIGR